MYDCLILGGGVIGLSLAYELAGHGLRVRVLDAGEPGREASWAAAGMIAPDSSDSPDPLERLAALGHRLHRQWAAALREETGIDNGWRSTGALYLARDEAEAQELEQLATHWQAGGIACKRLEAEAAGACEPELSSTHRKRAAWLLCDECQVRSPWHLQALVVACARRGVELSAGVAVHDFVVRGQRVERVCTSAGDLAAGSVCLAAGAWSQPLAKRLGLSLRVKPVRGQMVLLAARERIVRHIIHEALRYLVPRDDGRVLVGSTEEDAGFDRRTTAEAVSALIEFAVGLVPALASAHVERTWAGLRPGTEHGLPYLGRVPGLANAYLATGHFRSGMLLSPATAVVVGQLIRGETPQIDLSAFEPN
jgi:glycine oxidase